MSGAAGARDEGLRLLQAGELNGALSLLQRAVTQDPTDGKAFGCLGVCYARLGDYANAVGALQQAVRLLPNDPAQRFNLGMTLFHAQRYPEARQELELALSLEPNHTGARDLLARLNALGPAAQAAPPATGGLGSMSQPMGNVSTPPAAPLSSAGASHWNPSSSPGGPVAPPMPSWNSPAGAGTTPSMPSWPTNSAPVPGAFPSNPLSAPDGSAPTPFAGAPGIGAPTPTSGAPLPGSPLPVPPLSGVPGTEPVPGTPPTGWMPAPTPEAPVGGLQYTASAEAVPEGKAPGIMRRMLRGVFWGMIYGHQWTLWQAISRVIFGRAFRAEFLWEMLFFAIINTFFGALTGFVIGAANARDRAAVGIAIANGFAILLLLFALSQSPFVFINVLFYFVMGRSVGEGIAKRVHQPVGV